MAKCWTCGTNMGEPTFTCPSCNGLKQLKNLNEKAINFSKGLNNLAEIQYKGFNELKDVFSDKLSEIASAIEWGFQDLSWHLEQQTEVIRSIDHTLKTPTQTQANEWRLMADELSRRGVLDEAEKHYLKSIESNLLDYRTYLGLGHLYIGISEFKKAKSIFEKSLPHAPKKEIDYKSYSYRLIGHIYECWDDFGTASAILSNAIKLSPNYVDGHYDYSRYCAQVGNVKDCIPSLRQAIHGNPLYWDLAKSERTFMPVMREVGKVLWDFRTDGVNRVNNSIEKTNKTLMQAKESINKALAALNNSGDQSELNSPSAYRKIENNVSLANQKVDKLNYLDLLNLELCVNNYNKDATNVVNQADKEKDHYLARLADKIRNSDQRIGIVVKNMVVGGIVGGIPGCVLGCLVEATGRRIWNITGTISGWVMGAFLGIIIGLLIAKGEMPSKIR